MFHYDRMKGSDGKIVKDYFLTAYGTKTVGNHTSICESAKWTAHELTWGSHYDNWDFENTKFILNFGSNVLEAHTNHVPEAQRCIAAMARGVPMYTFDVRLSNTAAKSTEWVPIKPGTDLAVVLAMCNVLMENDICDKEFIETYTNVTVDELKTHLARYTPQWAEKISGVPAEKIRTIVLAYGRAKPSVCISYRGAVMHYNGVQTERAIFMLESIAGNIDCPGGRCRAVGANWKFTFPKPTTKAGKLHVLDGEHGAYAYPTHHASHKGFHALPSWMPIPEHEKTARDDLHLTTFKVNAQTHSRTQQCKWLTEIYHENPAWIHPKTTAARQVSDGDLIKVKSSVGEIITKARVTESIVPGTVAISYYYGHWAWGDTPRAKPARITMAMSASPTATTSGGARTAKTKAQNNGARAGVCT